MRKVGVLIFLHIGLTQILFGQKPEIYVQMGHRMDVGSVIPISSDGKIIASSSTDGTIKIWNTMTGVQSRTIYATPPITSIAFSPDGTTIASSTYIGDIEIWNVLNGKKIKQLSEKCSGSLIFSPNGEILSCNSRRDGEAGYIKLWNILKDEELYTITESSRCEITFSPDGELIAGCSENGIIKLWNILNRKEIKNISGNSKIINSIAFNSDGKIIASASSDTVEFNTSTHILSEHNNIIKLFEVSNGEEIQTIPTNHRINNIKFTPDEKKLIGYENGSLKYWELATGKEQILLEGFGWDPISYSSDLKIAASKANGYIISYNLITKKITSFSSDTSELSSMAISANGKNLACGFMGDYINLWNISSDMEMFTLEDGWVTSLTFSPDGEYLVSGTSDWDSKFSLWNVSTRKKIYNWGPFESTFNLVTAFSPDNKTIAVGSSKTTIGLVDVSTKLVKQILNGHPEAKWIESLAFSPNGKTLASSGDDGTIKLWDVSTGAELRKITNGGTFAFSPDGKIIATNDKDGVVLWDVVTGSQLKSFTNFYGAKLMFSPNGKYIAVLGKNLGKNVKILDISTNAELLNIDTGTIAKSIAFTPDSNYLVIGYDNSIIKIWDIVTNKELVNLYPYYNGWLVITPEGFFDGTPNAWKQVLWRFNNNTFDYSAVETYFNDFFYPNLLQSVLAGKSPKPKSGVELEKVDRRQPKIEISSINGLTRAQLEEQNNNQILVDKRLINVSVEAVENIEPPKPPNHQTSGQVRDLRLFRNGSLVKIWHGETIEEIVKNNKSDCRVKAVVNNSGRKLICQTGIQIASGDNDFTAYAFNSANVKSNDDSVKIKGADSLKREGTLYILAIGINKYADPSYNLNFAVPDVVDISNALKDQQDKIAQDKQLQQYAKTEIITLTDENATKSNILLALSLFSEGNKAIIPNKVSDSLKAVFSKIKPAQPEDAVLIYYSGHGTSKGERFYLMPHNFTGEKGVKSLEEQGVSDNELNETLEKVDAGKLLMIIDACQSGQALGGQNDGRGPMNSKGLAQLAYDKGMLILTAAQSRQAALEAVKIGNKEIKHGLLTYALLEALSKPEADQDGNKQLWEKEWLDYAVEQVPQLQLEAMKQRHLEIGKTGKGTEIIYAVGDNKNANPNDRKVQTPRVFYHRESEINPMIIAKN